MEVPEKIEQLINDIAELKMEQILKTVELKKWLKNNGAELSDPVIKDHVVTKHFAEPWDEAIKIKKYIIEQL